MDKINNLPGANPKPYSGGVTVTTFPDGTRVVNYPTRDSTKNKGIEVQHPDDKDKNIKVDVQPDRTSISVGDGDDSIDSGGADSSGVDGVDTGGTEDGEH